MKLVVSLTMLAWLTGTWSFEKDGRKVTEHWLAPAADMMLGVSHTVANGKTVEHEFISIRQDANGDTFFVARPSGQPEASFKLVHVGEKSVVFENPGHDFPQKITYGLQPDGSLLATIEGTKEGKTRRVEFPYQRVKQ